MSPETDDSKLMKFTSTLQNQEQIQVAVGGGEAKPLFWSNFPKIPMKQECIPVGCVPLAAVALCCGGVCVSPGVGNTPPPRVWAW